MFVKAGSRFESVPGTSHLLEQVAFRSTQKRSAAKIQRDVEDYGAVVAAKAGRETVSMICLSIDLPDNLNSSSHFAVLLFRRGSSRWY